MKIIGIAGYARSGKDTLGSFLVEDHGYEQRSFAAALKEVLYQTNPLAQVPYDARLAKSNPDRFVPVQYLVDCFGWDRAKELSPGKFGVRGLLQRLGTEGGREVLGQNIWVDTVMSTLEPGGRYVFTDMRFPNEHGAIQNRCGLCVRVNRPGTEPVNPHISETALDNAFYDGYVLNDGTLEDLRSYAAVLARSQA